MLNKEGQRELAYLIRIDDIQPITGSDNCECAVVGGWHVMTRKGTFKKGDLAVYFEIDSKVDTTKPYFSFLESKHGCVKTQRYTFGGKGLFYSEGLLMHPSDFGWEVYVDDDNVYWVQIDNKYYKSGDFLTEILGVTYAVAEDNKRKSNRTKYDSMKDRHKKLFKKFPFKQLMRYNWGRKFLFFFFGKKKDKKKDWPGWVKKTDEERCLVGMSKVETEDGKIQISKIVNNRLPVKVLSVNPYGECEYRRVVGWHKLQNDDKLITIRFPYRVGSTRQGSICCTKDHKILTNRGYVEASDIVVGDTVFMPTYCYGEDSLGAIYGMLLGDSNISIDKRSHGLCRVSATNGQKQMDYLKYKRSIFDGKTGEIVCAGLGSFGKVPAYHWCMNVDATVGTSIVRDFIVDGKKTVTDSVVEKLNWEAIAFWYMDDGCLSNRDRVHSPFIRFNSHGFSYEENCLLSRCLEDKFGVKNTIGTERKNGKEFHLIRVSMKSVTHLLENITPYMCKSMAYKTLPEYEYLLETKKPLYRKTLRSIPVKVTSVEEGQKKNKYFPKNVKTVYDIDVEENHNFVADGIIVHNCQNMPFLFPDNKDTWMVTEKIDGSSFSATMKNDKKKELIVCSRNVRFDNNPNKPCYYDTNIYLEAAEKYRIKDFINGVLEQLTNKKEVKYFTIQGEVYGGNIQKRDYGPEHRLAIFNIIIEYVDGRKIRLNPVEMSDFISSWNDILGTSLETVPIIDTNYHLPSSCDEMLTYAHGESKIDGKLREGVVLRTVDGERSFKAVDQEYLVQYHG